MQEILGNGVEIAPPPLKEVTYSSLSQLQEVDALVAFSFGLGKNHTPGQINKALASATATLQSKTILPILSQEEVAEELQVLNSTPAFTTKAGTRYFNTRQVAQQIGEYARALGLKKLAVVAHPDHQYRAGKLLEAQGFTVYFPEVPAYLPERGWEQFGLDQNGYWRESAQPWTTSKSRYQVHEAYSRVIDFVATRKKV